MSRPRSDLRPAPSCLRSAAAFVLLVAFTLLQGIAPLLHAHVGSATGLASGVHLPDGTAAFPHGHAEVPAAEAAQRPCVLEDGALVTAATEHRRDDSGLSASGEPPVADAGRTLLLPVPAEPGEVLSPQVRRARSQSPPPYSHGPPPLT